MLLREPRSVISTSMDASRSPMIWLSGGAPQWMACQSTPTRGPSWASMTMPYRVPLPGDRSSAPGWPRAYRPGDRHRLRGDEPHCLTDAGRHGHGAAAVAVCSTGGVCAAATTSTLTAKGTRVATYRFIRCLIPVARVGRLLAGRV